MHFLLSNIKVQISVYVILGLPKCSVLSTQDKRSLHDQYGQEGITNDYRQISPICLSMKQPQRSFIFGTKLAGSCEGGDEGCLMESSRGWPTQSHSTSTDPHLQDSTKLKIQNLYVVTTREGPVISDDYRHGHISYMFVDETTSVPHLP